MWGGGGQGGGARSWVCATWVTRCGAAGEAGRQGRRRQASGTGANDNRVGQAAAWRWCCSTALVRLLCCARGVHPPRTKFISSSPAPCLGCCEFACASWLLRLRAGALTGVHTQHGGASAAARCSGRQAQFAGAGPSPLPCCLPCCLGCVPNSDTKALDAPAARSNYWGRKQLQRIRISAPDNSAQSKARGGVSVVTLEHVF